MAIQITGWIIFFMEPATWRQGMQAFRGCGLAQNAAWRTDSTALAPDLPVSHDLDVTLRYANHVPRPKRHQHL